MKANVSKRLRACWQSALVLSMVGLIASCGGAGSSGGSAVASPADNTPATPAEIAAMEKKIRDDIHTMYQSQIPSEIIIPPSVDSVAGKSTLEGIDTNGNRVRDDIEIILSQGAFNGSKKISAIDFQKTLELIAYMQPSIAPKEINQIQVYCKYKQLSEAVQEEFDLDFLAYLVTNTKERSKTYHKQSTNTSGGLGEIVCQ